MLKRVDVAVFKACEDLAHGKWTSNKVRYGLSTDGVGYAMDSYNDALVTPAIRATVEKLKADLIAGRIKAPDFYLTRDHGN
jgi:basic membrane protein A